MLAQEPPKEEDVLSGQELLEACENTHDENQLCMTFVVGLVATVDGMQEQNPGEKLFCIDPQRVAPEDVRDKIVQWLKRNQPRLHEAAYILASEALNKSYPCQPSA
ncbi:MAG TPA: Rap1a/Tai family immunity protein [Gammaproteobacteria bacterium]|nr:Rap1a/Tai family immunity protein [Gammaproteobacteria bacterium]